MASILSNPTYRAKLPRYGHPMDFRVDFTSSVGQLLPVLEDVLSPGEKVHIQANLFQRTSELTSKANADVINHLEYFFVPFTKIMTLFDSWIYQIDDISTTFDYSKDYLGNLPYMNSDLIAYLYSQVSDSPYGTGFDSSAFGMIRLFDMFQNLGQSLFTSIVFDSQSFNYLDLFADDYVNRIAIPLYYFAAYQAIYYDYYRNSLLEPNDPRAYNLDRFYSSDFNHSTTASENTFSSEIVGLSCHPLFTLRYRSWVHDYFTSAIPSPLQNNMSMLNAGGQNGASVLSSAVNQWLVNNGYSSITNSNSPYTTDDKFATAVQTTANAYQLNTAAVRTMFAVEKLNEITRRAGKHYDDQTLAHFGFKVPTGISGECYYLGDHKSQLHIGEVISPSTTEGSAAGEITGIGWSNLDGNKPIEFTAPCHGILMAIFSAEPKTTYAASAIPKDMMLLQREDFPMPETDNLGMQPMFGYEQRLVSTGLTSVLWWQYRFQEFKLKPSRSLAGFGYRFNSFLSASGDDIILDPKYSVGSEYNWNLQRDIMDSLNVSNFLIRPNSLNSILLYQYDPNLFALDPLDFTNETLPYLRDPLKNFLSFHYVKSSWMSTYGLPNLN